ncbi:hypothetical protein C5615_16790 [Burkholderia cepacia]|uniref:Secreted protein n=1 Tax=Burkholderia cepacia TaxID=292 RepID=A0A2S8IRT6_BURCE|nr:hypothetical protein C5615_16790 [Burkholderia cepacia]
MLSTRFTATLTQVLRVAATAAAGVASATVSGKSSLFFDVTIRVTFQGLSEPDRHVLTGHGMSASREHGARTHAVPVQTFGAQVRRTPFAHVRHTSSTGRRTFDHNVIRGMRSIVLTVTRRHLI